MNKVVKRALGDPQMRTLKRLTKRVASINKLADKYEKMSDKELQKQTDILKKKLKDRGDDSQIIEDEVNSSLYLQLILDLSNQEKHGYPLTETRRSKKDPLIKNVGRALSPSNKPDNIRYELSDGSAMMNVMVIITADVTDSKGNLLCRLDELIGNAQKAWEQIIKKYNIA